MEYRIAFRWRIFMYIAAPLIGAIGVWPFFLLNNSLKENGLWITLLIIVLSLGFIAGCIYSFLRIHREKVVVKNGELIHHLAFTIKELRYDQVKGVRTDSNYIHIIPKDDSLKAIRVSSYIENKINFLGQIYDRFENLDSKDTVNELAEILSNEKYGIDKNERENRLKFANKTTRVFNTLSFVLALWLLVYPHPYDLAVFLNILVPFIGLFLFYAFKGLIKLNSSKISAFPNIATPLILPGLVLVLRCIFDFKILSYSNFWFPAFIFSLIFFALFFIRSEELKKTDGASLFGTVSLFLFFSVHISTSMLMLNTLFDFERPSVHQALVIEKNKPSDGNDYKLVLEKGWEPRITSEQAPIVSKEFFNKTKVGDSVYVNVFNGVFNIPWYYIDEYRFTKSKIESMNFQYDVDTTIFKFE
ncbi:MAG: hypothetical protein JJ971_03655 [Balneolaceae bacterium]|nr:hypothetical protein [Balneolaceae bacterium]MBO6545468.1 hypothetical protein [Balneolaceae bacterium]MBO6646864.1 hypothetical protein [Balneolaceae bacterium]